MWLSPGCRLVDSARNNGPTVTTGGNAGPGPRPGKPAQRPPRPSQGVTDHQTPGPRPGRTCEHAQVNPICAPPAGRTEGTVPVQIGGSACVIHSLCCLAGGRGEGRRPASPPERAIPRANAGQHQATPSYARRLLRQVKCPVSHVQRCPGGDWGSRGRRFKSGRPDAGQKADPSFRVSLLPFWGPGSKAASASWRALTAGQVTKPDP